MALHPLADRVVAKPVEAESKTASGILLPDQAKDKVQTAKVLAVGKDVKEVKVNDVIVHTEYGPNRFKQGSEELLIVKEEDILAVVKG
jgi:chaperonin GroES